MYYSGKHKIYCLKSEVTHAPVSGLAMRISTAHPGARHDFDIFSAEIGSWIEQLQKTPAEKERSASQAEDHWQQLAEKGYQGANSLPGVHMHHPHKKQG